MRITLQQVSKHFGREAVLNKVDHVFEHGSRTAIIGPNGSGKSTLVQLVAGASIPTAGTIEHALSVGVIPQEEVYRHVSIAAPYLGLYEDLPLREMLSVHGRFKAYRNGLDAAAIAHAALLGEQMDKPVRNFSSGMKQRLKLALAILSDTPLLILDEPASNLDAQGIAWFRDLLHQHLDQRTLLVASNRQAEETFACDRSLEVSLFKR